MVTCSFKNTYITQNMVRVWQAVKMKTWLLGVGVILFSLCTEIQGECCLDGNVAYTGKQMFERARAGDQYFVQFFKRSCPDPDELTPPDTLSVCTSCTYPNEDDGIFSDGQGKCEDYPCCRSGPVSDWDKFSGQYYCNDLNPRVGRYCGRGECNMFGCNCDGGCIERPAKRRLLSESDASSSSNETTVAKCQEQVTTSFNTTLLREKDQILAYYNCLETVVDGILDEKDVVIQELETTLNGSSRLKAMDTNQDGGIQPSEFDSALDDTLSTQSSGWLTAVSITRVLGIMILWVMGCS